MKKIYLIAFLLPCVLSSCMRKHKSDNLHYYQDFEAVKGWFGVNALSTDIPGHSGNYSIITNAQNDYSIGFTSKIGDISKKPLKKMKAIVWCNTTSKLCNGGFCIQIVNPANEDKLWISKPFADYIKSENKWTKGVIEADIPKDALNPENTVKVFLWNKGEVAVYGDDFEIEFTE